MEKRFIKTLVVIGAATMLVMPFLACSTSKNLEAGSSWEVSETTSLDKLTMDGDIINAMTPLADMNIAFENATITGAITTATIQHALGPNGEEVTMEHPELYKLIGEVTNAYCETPDKYGLKVFLDGKSKWVVSKTSYLTGLIVAEGANITTLEGYKVTMTVNGAEKAFKPGNYKGKIVLTVTRS